MTKRYDLTGGMNSVLPAEILPENTAALIENMRLGDDGYWRAIQTPVQTIEGISEPFTTPYVYAWKPVYLPLEIPAGQDTVYVCFSTSGSVSVKYIQNGRLVQTNEGNLLSGIDVSKLRIASDAQQFVFVDGRTGLGAQRIVIDPDGAVTCRRFGTQQPKIAPTINQIANAKYEDNEYTGLPVGSILFYSYCIVNEFGERSNPSPVVVCDTAQWFAKGELLVGEYAYSEVNGGSIKSVSLTCQIPVPAEAKRIEIYRTQAEYHESFRPIDPMRLVRSQDLSPNTDNITITDTSFTSPQEIDYENDTAPAGDDIVLESGTLFVANAVADRTFPFEADRIWAIKLNNPNNINYVNRWFTIDIRDEHHHDILEAIEPGSIPDYFPNLEAVSDIPGSDRYRFIDSDMITPLTAYMATSITCTGPIHRLTDGLAFRYGGLTYIRIPYLQAAAEKTIYLIHSTEDMNGYGSAATQLDRTSIASMRSMFDARVDSPVRDEKAILAQGTIDVSVQSIDGWQSELGNKANALYDYNDVADDELEDEQNSIVYTNDLDESIIVTSTKNRLLWNAAGSWGYEYEYERLENMLPAGSGYIYGNIHRVIPSDSDSFEYFLCRIDWQGDGSKNVFRLRLRADAAKLTLKFDVWNDESHSTLWSTEISTTAPITFTPGEIVSGFAFMSWQQIINPAADDEFDDVTIALIYHTNLGQRGILTITDQTDHRTARRTGARVSTYNNSNVCSGRWYVNQGEYISDIDEIMALSLYDTHFPTEPIGYRSAYKTIVGNKYVVNENVTIDTYTIRNEQRPGRIRWSRSGAVPQLYERNVHGDILRIMPLRSFMPTLEHNTILIWTTDKNVLQMALAGDNQESSALITLYRNNGVINPDSVCAIPDGVAWCSDTGIFLLNSNGLMELTGNIPAANYRILYNPQDREILFVNSNGYAYAYNHRRNIWSAINYQIMPRTFLEYAGHNCLVADDGIYDLASEIDESTLTPRILTRKFFARLKKNRITLHGTAGGTVRAYIYNHRLPTAMAQTPDYTLPANKPKAIPQLSGDYIQLNIVADNIQSFDIEERDGN